MPPNKDKSASVVNESRKCPRCGAVLHPGASVCWLCFAPIPPLADRPSQDLQTVHPPTSSFSLASLMMFVTLVAVVLGIFTIWLGSGCRWGLSR